MSATTYRALLSSDTITRPNNTTLYTAGDVISEVTTNDHFTFSDVVRTKGQTAAIESVSIQINSNQATKPELELWLFDKDIAEVADNSAFAPTDTEILTLIGVVDLPASDFKVGLSGSGASGNIVQRVAGLAMILQPDLSSDRAIYGQLVVRNGYTPIADETFRVELGLSLD